MKTIHQLTIAAAPVSQRPFRGLGVEADAYIFDEANRKAGVATAELTVIQTGKPK